MHKDPSAPLFWEVSFSLLSVNNDLTKAAGFSLFEVTETQLKCSKAQAYQNKGLSVFKLVNNTWSIFGSYSMWLISYNTWQTLYGFHICGGFFHQYVDVWKRKEHLRLCFHGLTVHSKWLCNGAVSENSWSPRIRGLHKEAFLLPSLTCNHNMLF